ncbi:hypothetical protein E6O75_ATG06436 [Venturia nashicola]|uniref:Uncharacterized protein n=1 Tax=Venturia nashicola TaxID=86259 RepID=A0A4Z1P2M2_9PEZI|nr:hypothetical protein E6O75_ATG06436 [Venturia nashicola]
MEKEEGRSRLYANPVLPKSKACQRTQGMHPGPNSRIKFASGTLGTKGDVDSRQFHRNASTARTHYIKYLPEAQAYIKYLPEAQAYIRYLPEAQAYIKYLPEALHCI